MPIRLHKSAQSHLRALIDAGKYNTGKSWSFSAADGDKLLGKKVNDWSRYSSVHLGEDTSEKDKTKARWKYPAAKANGNSEEVYRSGLIAVKQRAAQQGEKDIEDAADTLIKRIDKKESDKKASATRSGTMNFMTSTALSGGRFAHLAGFLSLPRKEAKRVTKERTTTTRHVEEDGAEEEMHDGRTTTGDEDDPEGSESGHRASDGRRKPEGENEPHPDEEDEHHDRPGGEARHRANRAEEGNEEDDPNAGDGNEDDDEDDDDEQGEEDEAELSKCKAAGFSRALRAAVRTERRRCRAIFGNQACAGRVPLACDLAFGTNLTAKQVVSALKNTPVAGGSGMLARAMERTARTRIGQDHPDARQPQTPLDRLKASARRLGIIKTEGGDAADRVLEALASRLDRRG